MSILSTPLDELLTSTSKVRVLRLLSGSASPLSAREIARRVGMARRAVGLALRDLVDLGVVLREDTSAQALLSINRRHALVGEGLAPLFLVEQRWTAQLFDALRALIAEAAADDVEAVRWAGIYGSVARGEEEPASDLDLAVVTATKRSAEHLHEVISDGATAIATRFGRRVSPLVLPIHQARKLAAAKDPLVGTLLTDARRVYGSADLAEVLRGST